MVTVAPLPLDGRQTGGTKSGSYLDDIYFPAAIESLMADLGRAFEPADEHRR